MYTTIPQQALGGCGCSKGRGLSGLGHDGLAGTDAPPIDGVSYLQAQVNRFTAQAGAGTNAGGVAMALWPVGVPIDGVLSNETAMRALLVLQNRALFDGDLDLLTRVTRDGFRDPVGWVKANLATTTNIIQNYGDKNGLAPGSITRTGIPSWMFYAIAGGAALFLLGRRKRR